ncbi:acetyl-CoA carboxylase biotin carboxyl carrier protein [Bacillus sp. T33-2]|uniref:acetyl-CoA carboxylase biotin carboxyl carrier protein n=1 Tax=Bacillus sp. T33-2 TaxID=2054168 RepID=UPI000C776DB0|nr:acetyl-CoA carboxylase biotin carboxyl carrier protein [Bacillus sp. T33-2]PLR99881.1 acetyl-CoA carboxylase biotin carboxyl carrier protein [Bacillus sp. T33-2]
MLKIQEIRELIRLVDQSSIDSFEFEHEGSKIKMKKKQVPQAIVQPAQPAVVEAVHPPQEARRAETKHEPAAPARQETVTDNAAEAENLHKITSPMVGTFYQSSSPDSDPYVKPGDKVSKDSVVCIVEAMKLFNEIEAEINGEIVEILAKDGQLVEYGQPLFLVKPE